MWRRPSSIKLVDLFGIRIGVDRSWFVILFLLIFLLSGSFRAELHSSDGVAYLTTVVTVLILFASLIVHELGHALVARRQGIEIRRIDLFMFGGLTQMSRDAISPGEDFKIAAAGPLATFVFLLVCMALDVAIVGPHRLVHAAVLDSTVRITPVLLSLSWLLTWNILLFFFNLLPAFPLDGGRITRSIVWRLTGDKRRGTQVAAKLGQGLALILAGLGIWLLTRRSFGGLWLIAIAFVLGQAARGAVMQTAVSQRIEGIRVADIMDSQPVAIPADTAVGTALEDFFLRYGWSWFPVVDAEGHFQGVVRQDQLQSAFDRGEGWLTVGAVFDPDEAAKWHVGEDRLLSELLSSEALSRWGALVAVDREGVLRGVVTVDQVRRALQSALQSSATS